MSLRESLKERACSNVNRIPREYRGLIEEYCSAIKKHFEGRLVSICVFGSVARGEPTPQSDIDVLVVAEGLPECFIARAEETAHIRGRIKQTPAYRSLRALGRSGLISSVFLTKLEVKSHPPILLDMLDDGIIIYDRGSFLKDVLNEIKDRLRELGAKKVVSKRGHYWVLKPDVKPGEVVKI